MDYKYSYHTIPPPSSRIWILHRSHPFVCLFLPCSLLQNIIMVGAKGMFSQWCHTPSVVAAECRYIWWWVHSGNNGMLKVGKWQECAEKYRCTHSGYLWYKPGHLSDIRKSYIKEIVSQIHSEPRYKNSIISHRRQSRGLFVNFWIIVSCPSSDA